MKRKQSFMRKKIGLTFMLLILGISMFFAFLAPSLHAAPLEARTKVRVGYFAFDGYHGENKAGLKTGYGYDILQNMLPYENWVYEYVGYKENLSWSDAQNLLDQGKIDLLTSATKSEERLKKYDYSALPIGTSSTMLAVKAGFSKYSTDNYQNWQGMRVGFLVGNTRNESFDRYAKKHGFTYQPIMFATTSELQEALRRDRVDMLVTSNLLKLQGVQIIDHFDEKPFYVIVKKGNKELLGKVNEALEAMRRKDANFAEKLYAKYYGTSTEGVISLNQKEYAFIEACQNENKVFKVLINPDRKPLSSITKGEEAKGLLVDLTKEIFRRAGLKVEFLPVATRAEYLAAMTSGQADVVCDFTSSDALAEKYGYLRTGPYVSSTVSFLVKKGYDGRGKICALPRNSITTNLINHDPDVEYIYYEDYEECQEAVLRGAADFTINYTRVCQEKAYAEPTNALTCVITTFPPVEFHMAVNLKNSYLLSSLIAKSTESITSKDLNKFSEQYTYYDRSDKGLLRLIYANPLVIVVGILLLALTLIATLFYYLSTKAAKKEKQSNEELSKALELAAKASAAKTEFLSRMSHDMRTPLNAIKNYAVFMEEATDKAEIEDYRRKIFSSEEYLETLINDTLGMSKIEAGKVEFTYTKSTYLEFEKSIKGVLAKTAADKGVDLIFVPPPERNKYELLDKLRIQQIFVNIINNAIKFTPSGGKIVVKVEYINETKTHTEIKTTVTDTGIGMSDEFLQKKLYQPFAQEKPGVDNEALCQMLG